MCKKDCESLLSPRAEQVVLRDLSYGCRSSLKASYQPHHKRFRYTVIRHLFLCRLVYSLNDFYLVPLMLDWLASCFRASAGHTQCTNIECKRRQQSIYSHRLQFITPL